MQLFNMKNLGLILVILAVSLFAVFYSFTIYVEELNQQLHKDCPLPEPICPFRRNIPPESLAGFFIDGTIGVIGLYIFLTSKTVERTSAVQSKKMKEVISRLEGDEKSVYNIILNSEGFIFQNELIQKVNMNKVKITRVLDKLEGKGIVERRRRGMANVVVLKH